MGFIKDFLREIDDELRSKRRINKCYKIGLKDKLAYEDAVKWISQNLSEYKNVRVEGCFYDVWCLNMKISYTSIFGIRLDKEFKIVTQMSSERFLNQLILDNYVRSYDKRLNDKNK